MKKNILVVLPDNKSYTHLNQEQRKYIAKRLKENASYRQIASELWVSHSTISREINRNSIDKWRWKYIYDPLIAHMKYIQRRLITSAKRRLFNKYPKLFEIIEIFLKEYNWSPQQISWRLKLESNITVSYTTIYRWIRLYRDDLEIYLRFKSHPPKKWKKYRYKHKIKWQLVSRISERLKEINDRERIWDFEVDTILSNRKWSWWLLTIVDRKSRYTIALKLERITSSEVYNKFRLLKWKIEMKTITSDNGLEFALADKISKELWIHRWYLCDPYSSWQRWTNERINWMIRWFIPKWTDFKSISQGFVNEIVDKLNLMPRKIHNFLTPYEIFFNTRLNLIN